MRRTYKRGNAGARDSLRFDCQLRFVSARIRIFGKLGRQNVSRFIGRALFNGAASSALTGEIDSAGAFAGAR